MLGFGRHAAAGCAPGGRLVALLAAMAIAGCGAGRGRPATDLVRQQESQALGSVASAVRSADIPSPAVGAGGQSSMRCPAADRGAGRGTATFTFGGTNRISFTQDACPVAEILVGHPELSYRGPAGCRGQFFFGDGTDADPTGGLVDWFRYGAHDAYLVARNQVYHFVSAPRTVHGRVRFDQRFDTERITVTISCPPPRPSHWLLPRND